MASAPGSPMAIPPMLSPTLPAWCYDGTIPQEKLSPHVHGDGTDAAAHHPPPTPRPQKLHRHHDSALVSDSESSDEARHHRKQQQVKRKRFMVTLKISNVKALKQAATRPKPREPERTTKKRLSSAAMTPAEPIKRSRISRSYSSSEESDVPPARPTVVATKKTTTPASLPPKPATVPNKPTTKSNSSGSSNGHASRPPSKSSISPEPRKQSSAGTTASTSASRPSQEQRASHHQLLMKKMSRWAHLARNQKHESDKHSKTSPLRAGVIAMDALLAYIVAFDYEDRAEVVMQRVKHTRSWATLVPYTGWLINLLEEGDCRDLIGACYQIRALIHLRVASSLQEQITKLHTNPNTLGDADIGDLAMKLIKAHDAAVQDFKRGQRDLAQSRLEQQFPQTWSRRHPTVQPTSRHEGGYRPLEDPYFLPLHAFSTLQEAAALGYAVTKEWADRQGISCDWALVRGLN